MRKLASCRQKNRSNIKRNKIFALDQEGGLLFVGLTDASVIPGGVVGGSSPGGLGRQSGEPELFDRAIWSSAL